MGVIKHERTEIEKLSDKVTKVEVETNNGEINQLYHLFYL